MEGYVKKSVDDLSSFIYVFIDASNLWQAQKSKGRLFDYEKLKNFLKSKFSAQEIKIFYFSAYPRLGTRDYDLAGKHRFLTYLKKGLNFVVRKKELKRIMVHEKGAEKLFQEKGNMDVEMTIDALHFMAHYDTAIFFTGDSDFLALIKYLRNRNKIVYIFSSKNNVSEELRTGSNGYFDVLTLQEDIWGKELQRRKAI